MRRSRAARSRPLRRALALLGLCSCVALPGPAHPRPALPLPEAYAAAFALPGEVVEEQTVPAGSTVAFAYVRGAVRAGGERATFHLLQPTTGRPAPVVLCLPILAGGAELMWHVAANLARRGFAAMWADRCGPALTAGQRSADLNELFTRTLIQNRMLLAWARRQPHRFLPDQRALLGISTGGILGAILLALEPDVRAGALCLAGSDLPDLLLESTETRIVAWRDSRRRRDGVAGTFLRAELARDLLADPAHLAPFVATERVLLVQARLDDVVPVRNQDLLWEGLGRPRRLQLPLLGHYPAALALDAILDEISVFVRARLRAGR